MEEDKDAEEISSMINRFKTSSAPNRKPLTEAESSSETKDNVLTNIGETQNKESKQSDSHTTAPSFQEVSNDPSEGALVIEVSLANPLLKSSFANILSFREEVVDTLVLTTIQPE